MPKPNPNDPPNKDKDDEGLLDDSTSSDLGGGVDLSGGEPGDEPGSGPGSGQPEPTELSPELQELMVKKGFKDVNELVNYTRNLEKKNTELSGAQSFVNPAPINIPEIQLEEPEEVPLEIPDDLYETISDPVKGKKMMSDFVEHVKSSTKKSVERDFKKRELTRMRNEVINKVRQDPQKFQRLRPRMVALANAYPDADVHQLMAEAERLEGQDSAQFRKQVEDIVGVDLDQLKAIVPKVKPVSISSSPGGGGLGALNKDEVKRAEDQLKKDILGAETLNE